VSDGTADVADGVYVGCLGVGEAARGGQLIASQGQEWVFAPQAKEAGSPSK
jgi:hypothetical protein